MSTLKEIAALSGYSVSTVSVVLGGKSEKRGIPETTQKRILEAAAALHYQPNIAARALRDHDNQGMFLIALFWSQDFRAPMMLRFLKGIRENMEKRTSKKNIRFVINFYDNDKLCEEPGLKSLSYYHAAIVCNASAKDMDFLEHADLPVPIVLYNRRSEKYNSVLVDDSQFGILAARIFASHKKRSAQVITSQAVFPGMEVRRTTFGQTVSDLGMELRDMVICDNSMAGGYQAAIALAESGALPEALYCGSDAIALGVLRAFYEKRISVPQQVELIAVGNGDKEQEIYAVPSLSVVVLPMEEMASRCLDRLLEIQTAPLEAPRQEYMELRYVPRESCGPLKGTKEDMI